MGSIAFFLGTCLENNLFLPTGLVIEQKCVLFLPDGFFAWRIQCLARRVRHKSRVSGLIYLSWMVIMHCCLDKLKTVFSLQVSFD